MITATYAQFLCGKSSTVIKVTCENKEKKVIYQLTVGPYNKNCDIRLQCSNQVAVSRPWSRIFTTQTSQPVKNINVPTVQLFTIDKTTLNKRMSVLDDRSLLIEH